MTITMTAVEFFHSRTTRSSAITRRHTDSQDFTQAFANSCNGAFANLGTELELTSYRNLAEQLLFNRSLPLDIPYNKSTFSMQPDAETWEVLQTSIGLGQT